MTNLLEDLKYLLILKRAKLKKSADIVSRHASNSLDVLPCSAFHENLTNYWLFLYSHYLTRSQHTSFCTSRTHLRLEFVTTMQEPTSLKVYVCNSLIVSIEVTTGDADR